MSQMSFSDFEYAGKRKQTRRERFLAEMDQVVPWSGLLTLIKPYYPKAGGGRKPYPLETMLRIHLLQNWFSLSDPAMEEALYEITPIRQFAHLTLSAPIPEDTTIMSFRHLLESISWHRRSLRSSMVICRKKASLCVRAPLSMRRLSMRPARPRTKTASVIQRCTKRRKGTHTSLG
ncbi:Transposase InsH N-terminal domain-containing protein [Pseudomonas plecoglossicida]